MGASQRGHRAGGGGGRAETVRRWDPPRHRAMAGGAPAADRPAESPEGPLQVRSGTEIPVAGDQRERGGTGERSRALRNKGARR